MTYSKETLMHVASMLGIAIDSNFPGMGYSIALTEKTDPLPGERIESYVAANIDSSLALIVIKSVAEQLKALMAEAKSATKN